MLSRAKDTCVDRARRDEAYVREALREARALLLNSEGTAADILLESLAQGAPHTELAVQDAADLLGVSGRHIDALMERGLLSGDGGDGRSLCLADVVRHRKKRVGRS